MISRLNILFGYENKDKGTRSIYYDRCVAMSFNPNSYHIREEYDRMSRYVSTFRKKASRKNKIRWDTEQKRRVAKQKS